MDQRNEARPGEPEGWKAGQIEHQLLLIPEAPILLALLLIAWAYDFPPAVGILAAITVAVFLLRLGLIMSAARRLEQADYHRADQLSRLALRLYPWSADALTLRAQGLLLQGENGAAEPILRRASRLAPDSDMIHSALAGASLARGRFAIARAHAVQAERLASGSPYAAQHLAWLALHVDGDPLTATRILSEVNLQHVPETVLAPLLLLLAEARIARGALLAAAETLAEVEEIGAACPVPQQAEVLYHLGRLYTTLGEDGRPYFRRSVNLDPQGRYAQAAWLAALERDDVPRPLAAS